MKTITMHLIKSFKSILVISTSLLFIACEKEVEFKGSGGDPVLVLNGVVENDSTFKVYLEHSRFFLDNQTSPVDAYIQSGATIKVTNVNTGLSYAMTAATDLNMYEFPFTTEENVEYKIEVQHPDYPTITSSTKTVSKTELLSVDTSSVTKDGMQVTRAVLKWNDPVENNYYLIRVQMRYDDGFNGIQTNTFAISSTDISLDNSTTSGIDGTVFIADYLLLDDKLFNGKEKQLTIEFASPFFNPTPDQSVIYNLISMNKETYMYYLSVRKQQDMNFLSEPVKIYSNIQNGFGIFGTLNYSKIVMQ